MNASTSHGRTAAAMIHRGRRIMGANRHVSSLIIGVHGTLIFPTEVGCTRRRRLKHLDIVDTETRTKDGYRLHGIARVGGRDRLCVPLCAARYGSGVDANSAVSGAGVGRCSQSWA